ncbi:prenyltransferase/squalene oxidase repeat-containing protein [Glycomyces tenuis]|uniref:prenyltransferase/squalene oxidase repeat-containing protein n=1 Tax=Glycomyces tenuis TaxID=58116 RepID=UPI0004214CBC|nr:prenyltransferase/squalene oxidase repeat-containing protein [Glycomyces tenuis]
MSSPSIRDRQLFACLERALHWVAEAYVDDVPGWPVTRGGSETPVWGGGIDGVRAFTAVERVNELVPGLKVPGHFNVRLDDVVDTILRQQKRNGSFPLREQGFAGIEPTVWVLVGLKEYGHGRSQYVARALAYLSSRVAPDGTVRSGVEETDRSPRVIPAALTLWAFTEWGHDLEAQDRIRNFLFRVRDPNTGGWSARRNGTPSPAMTGMVLHVLSVSDTPVSEEVKKAALRYLARLQQADGSWPPVSDHWAIKTRREVRFPHFHVSGNFWILLALARCDEQLARDMARRLVRYILAAQETAGGSQTRGSWDDTFGNGTDRYVWLVSQGIVALVEWRLSRPRTRRARMLEAGRDAVRRVRHWLVKRRLWIVVVGLTLVVLAPQIDDSVRTIADWFRLNPASLREELVAGGIVSIVIGLASELIRSPRRRRRR